MGLTTVHGVCGRRRYTAGIIIRAYNIYIMSVDNIKRDVLYYIYKFDFKYIMYMSYGLR